MVFLANFVEKMQPYTLNKIVTQKISMKSQFCPEQAKGEIRGFLGKRKKDLMMMESCCLRKKCGWIYFDF